MSKFILAADLHIRNDRPRCRIDENWEETQRLMIQEIVSIANGYKCPLIITGDLFDNPNIPARFIVMLLNELSKIDFGNLVHYLAGNHELPYHSIDNVENSSMGILMELDAYHAKIEHGMNRFGLWSDFNCKIRGSKNTGLLFIHRLVFESIKTIPPNVSTITASDLLKEYPDSKWIFLGDNHQFFHYEKNGKHVLNPGCTIRQKSDEQKYKPSVCYVDTEKEIVERIFLNDNIAMVNDSYLVEENERENRIEAFVEGIKKNGKISLDFLSNVQEALSKNKKKMDQYTIDMVYELLEEEK
jgi:DNA repair exonuclease SbcCD nuclease subunit